NGAVSGQIDEVAAEVVAEITDRLHAGQHVDVEAYIAPHPGLADRLRRPLPALQVLDAFSPSGADLGQASATGGRAGLHGALGGLGRSREVGRGGRGGV